jgi:hypothetical protein
MLFQISGDQEKRQADTDRKGADEGQEALILIRGSPSRQGNEEDHQADARGEGHDAPHQEAPPVIQLAALN